MNEVLNAIKRRRSVRSFKPEQIGREELDLILEAGIYAPSGNNTQPWYFTVIRNRSVIEHISSVSNEIALKMLEAKEEGWQMIQAFIERRKAAGGSGKFDITYGAPTLIIVSGWKDPGFSKHVLSSCSAAMQNMLIAAESLSIGSIWLESTNRCFRKEGETALLKIPEGYEPLYGIALGYKNPDYQPQAPVRNGNIINYID